MTSTPRVAFLVDNLGIGGTELNAVRTAEQLTTRGYEIVVIALHADGPLRERYEAAGIPVLPIRVGSFLSTAVLGAGKRLRHILRERQIEILHSHDYYSNVFAALSVRPDRPKLLMSRRWWHSPSRQRRLLGRLAYVRADLVLANSSAVRDLLAREEAVPRSRVVVVPNFVDDEAFVPDPRPWSRALRRELELPEDTLVFGIVARLSEEKGHDVLLRAYARAAEAFPTNHCLVLIGDGPERDRLRALAEELKLGSHVRFIGYRKPAPNLHAHLDVSLLTSRSEGFPNSVIEAMAASRPIVATRVGGVADAIEHGASGLLVEPDAVEPLADAVRLLASSPELRARIGRAAFERACERFRAKTVVDGLEAVYRSLTA